MSCSTSIADLIRNGATLQPDEAVAITQQLIIQRSTAQPPFGPPSVENVFVAADGSVTCIGCDATLSVAEAAIFLQKLLPPSLRVPGGLRYTIARALHDVEAPPYDSLQEFSRALERHEHGDRAALVRRFVARATSGRADRRRTAASSEDLRRQLRDADARMYEQQRALDALGAMMPTSPRHSTWRVAIAAALFAGLAVLGLGEAFGTSVADRTQSGQAVVNAPTVAEAPAEDAATAADVALPSSRDSAAVLSDRHSGAADPDAPAPRTSSKAKSATKQTRRVSSTPHERNRHRSPFHWLKTKFVIRADPLP